MAELIDVAELYVVDPDEFVATRTAISKGLRAAGDKEGAAAVAAMRKPPRSVWALNRVARAEPELVSDALDAAGALGAAIGGGGDVRSAMGAYRAATDRLLDAAGAMPGVATLDWRDRMQATVLAAGADAEVAEQLRSGTLTVDLPSPGVEALVPAGSDAPDPAPGGRRAAAPRRRPVGSTRVGGRSSRLPDGAANDSADDTEDDLATRRAAKAAAAAAEEAAAAARREAARERARLVKEIEQLRRRVDRLEDVAATARRRADEAEDAAASARDELTAAESRLVD